jgi:hypothetical protein
MITQFKKEIVEAQFGATNQELKIEALRKKINEPKAQFIPILHAQT